MSELSALTARKEELLAQIRRIEENCEGLENETNARKVSELNEKQMSLTAIKRELQAKLSALDGEINGITSKINELSGTGIDRILEAIKNQRWFWFVGKPKVLFDRDTALLWADLNYFPYNNCDVNRINDHMVDYSGQWQIPTPFELWKMIADKSFPFQGGGNWRILNEYPWTVFHNGRYHYRNLDGAGTTSSMNQGTGRVIPCCHALVPPDYENNISPSNNFYSEKEKLQFTLNIFTSNELIPLFADESITHLYRSIFVEKPALLKQLADVQTEINQLKEVVLLSSTFDYRALLTNYNIPAIDRSIIKYHAAVTSLADDFFRKFLDFENAKRTIIFEFNTAQSKLDALPSLDKLDIEPDDDIKELFERRRKTIASRLVLDLDGVKRQILSIKKQGETIAARIDKANHGDNSLVELAAIADEPRTEFELVAENLACIVREGLKKIEYVEQNLGSIFYIVNTLQSWEEAFIKYLNGSEDYYDERRVVFERAFTSLADYALQGHLLERKKNEPAPIERALTLLQTYRDEVEKLLEEKDAEVAIDKFSNERMKMTWAELTSSLEDEGDRTFLDGLMKDMLDEFSDWGI